MPAPNSIEETLALVKRERNELRQECHKKLRMLNETISTLEGLLKKAESSRQLELGEAISVDSRRFEGKSALEAAETVLREHGKPLTLKAIVRVILQGGFNKYTEPRKLYVNLYPTLASRHPDKFRRVEGERATFALVEWEK